MLRGSVFFSSLRAAVGCVALKMRSLSYRGLITVSKKITKNTKIISIFS
ncbi:hypothetical protein REIS_0306 [Rickettsia endosymbiont of Ixodes scapularis]|nr:hypothetical protein REIS_0306 [Rickettsia endosymbiont of Ixodes scapularis]